MTFSIQSRINVDGIGEECEAKGRRETRIDGNRFSDDNLTIQKSLLNVNLKDIICHLIENVSTLKEIVS